MFLKKILNPYTLGVKPSLYAKYYFELRTLFYERNGSCPLESNEWTLKPLSIIKARRLEVLNENAWEKPKFSTPLDDPRIDKVSIFILLFYFY